MVAGLVKFAVSCLCSTAVCGRDSRYLSCFSFRYLRYQRSLQYISNGGRCCDNETEQQAARSPLDYPQGQRERACQVDRKTRSRSREAACQAPAIAERNSRALCASFAVALRCWVILSSRQSAQCVPWNLCKCTCLLSDRIPSIGLSL